MKDTGYGKQIISKMEGKHVGGSVLQIEKGKRTDMIFHMYCEKVVYVLKGTITAWVLNNGKVAPLNLEAGNSFYVRPGLVHQLEALDASIVVEYISNMVEYENDITIVGKGSILEEKKVEDGANVKMTPEDEVGVKKTKKNKKKTKKKAPSKKRSTKKKSGKKS